MIVTLNVLDKFLACNLEDENLFACVSIVGFVLDRDSTLYLKLLRHLQSTFLTQKGVLERVCPS